MFKKLVRRVVVLSVIIALLAYGVQKSFEQNHYKANEAVVSSAVKLTAAFYHARNLISHFNSNNIPLSSNQSSPQLEAFSFLARQLNRYGEFIKEPSVFAQSVRNATGFLAFPFDSSRLSIHRRRYSFRDPGQHTHEMEAEVYSIKGKESDKAIIWVHGGGHMGTPGLEAHRRFLGELAYLTGMQVIAPDFNDLFSSNIASMSAEICGTYLWAITPTSPVVLSNDPDPQTAQEQMSSPPDFSAGTLGLGLSSENIIVGGDGTGASLALLGLSQFYHQVHVKIPHKFKMPRAFAFLSFWDPYLVHERSMSQNKDKDPVLGSNTIAMFNRLFDLISAHDGGLASFSPYQFAKSFGIKYERWPVFGKFPPALFLSGSDEPIVDHARRYVSYFQEANIRVTEKYEANFIHSSPIFYDLFPEAANHTRILANYIKSRFYKRK